MDDVAPDLLSFETLKCQDEMNKEENIFKLVDPPDFKPSTFKIENSYLTSQSMDLIGNFDDTEDLLNLHEPPDLKENENFVIHNEADKEISQIATDIVLPIVKKAIELHKTEMENVIIDNTKVGSNADKKSEKCLSADEFVIVKDDDFISDSKPDKEPSDDSFLIQDLNIGNNDDIQSFNGNSDSESFIKDNFKVDDILFKDQNISEQNFTINEEDSIIPTANLAENTEFEDSDKEEDYKFDIQGIIDASNNNPPPDSLENINKSLISNTNIRERFKDIICWRNPILTFVIFSVILVVEIGLMLDHSIISIFAYFGFILLLISFVYNVAVKCNLVESRKYSHNKFFVSNGDIQICVNSVLRWAETLFYEIRSLSCVTSVKKNIKAFVLFILLTYIGQYFNLISLIFFGSLSVFLVPLVYISFQKPIDNIINELNNHMIGFIQRLKCTFQTLFNSQPDAI